MTSPLSYHWTPSWNRDLVSNEGLRPHCPSTDGAWRPPYICLADAPSLAWALSGGTTRGAEHAEWDLWVVDVARLPPHDVVLTDFSCRPSASAPRELVRERRVPLPIRADDLWYVGSRVRSHHPDQA